MKLYKKYAIKLNEEEALKIKLGSKPQRSK